jgi:hypothetical protein
MEISSGNESINLSVRDEVRVTLEHIFDGPRNGIQSAFELLFSMLEAQRVQHVELLKEHQLFKTDCFNQIHSHQEQFQHQIVQVQQSFEMKILSLWEDMKTVRMEEKYEKEDKPLLHQMQQELTFLRESYKADITSLNEMNQLRLGQLEEKTDYLSMEIGILQESLLGGTTGTGGSIQRTLPFKSEQLYLDSENDHKDSKEFMAEKGSPSIQEPRPDSARCIQQGAGLVPCGSTEDGHTADISSIIQPSHQSEDEAGYCNGPIQDMNTSHDDGDPEINNLSEVNSSPESDQIPALPLPQPSIMFGNDPSLSVLSSTEGTYSGGKSTADEDASSSDNLSRQSSDDNTFNLIKTSDSPVQFHSQDDTMDKTTSVYSYDERRRETIRSSALNVINTIYESVRLKRQSKTMPSNPTLASKAHGVIVHLLDQEKIFEKDIQTLSTRIDSLTELLRSTNYQYKTVDNNQPPDMLESGSRNFVNLIHDMDGKSLLDLETKLSKLSADVASRVPQTHLRYLISIIYQTLKNVDVPSDRSDEDTLHDIIHALTRRCEDDNYKRNIHAENCLNNFKDTLWASLHAELSSRDVLIKESVDSLRQPQPLCNDITKSEGLEENSNHSNFDYSSVDDRIKRATESVQNSMRDLISCNLGQLAFIEEEVAKLTLQLAERPDDMQLNKMILDLEQVVSGKIGKTEIFESILVSLKQGRSHPFIFAS